MFHCRRSLFRAFTHPARGTTPGSHTSIQRTFLHDEAPNASRPAAGPVSQSEDTEPQGASSEQTESSPGPAQHDLRVGRVSSRLRELSRKPLVRMQMWRREEERDGQREEEHDGQREQKHGGQQKGKRSEALGGGELAVWREITSRKLNQRKEESRRVARYLDRYAAGQSILSDPTLGKLFDIIEEVDRYGEIDAYPILLEDVLQNAPARPWNIRRGVVERFLRLYISTKIVPKRDLLSILQLLKDDEDLANMLPLNIRARVAYTILSQAMAPELDTKIWAYLVPGLFGLLPRLRDPIDAYKTKAIWPLYAIAVDYAREGNRAAALSILQQLVATNHIASSAVQRTDLQSDDFLAIVLSALTRSCLQYQWHGRAFGLALRALHGTSKTLSEPVARLLVHVLRAGINEWTTNADLRTGASVLIQLLGRAPPGVLSEDVIQNFYKHSRRLNQSAISGQVYAESLLVAHEREHHVDSRLVASGLQDARSPEAKLVRFHVCPPSGAELLAFLEHLLLERRNVHLARRAAQQIVAEKLDVPPALRGRVVALFAVHGFATEARALWERWTRLGTGERDFVAGNASTMIKMVSLYANLIRRAVAEVRHGVDTVSPVNRLRRSRYLGRHPVEGAEEEARPEGEEAKPEEEGGGEGRPQQHKEHDTAFDWLRAGKGRRPGELELRALQEVRETMERLALPEEWDEEWDAYDMAKSEELQDLRAFAERVLNEFRFRRVSLSKLDHFALGALARAHFILGKVRMGFEVLLVMLKMRIRLDMHDVNIALSVLAARSPVIAARLMERMHASGLALNAVSYGTVIHQAVLHEDMELARELAQRAHDRGIKQLTFKTIGTLLRAVASSAGEGDAGAGLDQVEAMIDSLLEMQITPTTNMARDCVLAALRADHPLMAYRFWKLLLKDKVQWDDPVQARTRFIIARRIKLHVWQGFLDAERAGVMLAELHEDDVRVEGRRREWGLRPAAGAQGA
ncbi:hypothetical protein OBBRIDRAFT_488122 [Obba rivulosa]|uniref:Uncharacterized protein n=1 Tax=Obba rivulosa TaxID=1052685 RepID=A0A8E2B402_9APHY|nr:hypothetical protein OBBRIDRAFT_488122 [Obba rivulosa]